MGCRAMKNAHGWRRWSAIIVGFFGVLLIIRPGLHGFAANSLFGVQGVIGLAINIPANYVLIYGKLGFPAMSILAFALGCDMVHVAREPMMSIGCIQAQRCHTGHCPTGIATQNRWLMRGLDSTHKGARLANYIVTLRKEITQLSRVCGVTHPSLVTADQCEITDERFGSKTARELFGLTDSPEYGLPSDVQRTTLLELPKAVSQIDVRAPDA